MYVCHIAPMINIRRSNERNTRLELWANKLRKMTVAADYNNSVRGKILTNIAVEAIT